MIHFLLPPHIPEIHTSILVCEKGVFIKHIKTAVKVPVEYNVCEKIYGVTMWILDDLDDFRCTFCFIKIYKKNAFSFQPCFF